METKRPFFTPLGWVFLLCILGLLLVWRFGPFLEQYIDPAEIAQTRKILLWLSGVGFLIYMYDTKLFHS